VHYFEPHFSYINHNEFDSISGYQGVMPRTLPIGYLGENRERMSAEDWDYVRDVYDSEISWTDRAIGALLSALREWKLEERTIVVVVADHGEEFMERGRVGHPSSVYEELIHVPLIIYDPRDRSFSGARVQEPVETRSVGATILAMCGIEHSHLGGVDLLEVARGGRAYGSVYSEGNFAWHEGDRRTSLVLSGWKLIRNHDDGFQELYDLGRDPGERRNLLQSPDEGVPEALGLMSTEMDAFAASRKGRTEKGNLGPEDLERLRSLGYVE
jgi:arylsulfatase A-like enzyme